MPITSTFGPSYDGAPVTGGVASASVELHPGTNGTRAFVVTNFGPEVIYVQSGPSDVVATTASYPVLGGTQISLSRNQDHTHVAYVAPAGAPQAHIISGEGV